LEDAPTASLAHAAPLARTLAMLDRVRLVEGARGVSVLIDELAAPDSPTVVAFVNQHAVNVAWRDAGFAALLGRADVLLRDGLGAGLCLRALGRAQGENMNGTDFIPKLAAAFAGRRTVLFGTRDPWLAAAAARLREYGCAVVEVLDGFQADGAYADAARAVRPELVILAMGVPKQERVAALIAEASAGPVTIVSGGAIADFLAGRFARAPLWMRRSGLEWAFRLACEPGRLWRRYVTGGVAFAVRLLRMRVAARTRPTGASS
jgi:exopolysaccharide biosynthesis WecB/TagA/CpsF family protein